MFPLKRVQRNPAPAMTRPKWYDRESMMSRLPAHPVERNKKMTSRFDILERHAMKP